MLACENGSGTCCTVFAVFLSSDITVAKLAAQIEQSVTNRPPFIRKGVPQVHVSAQKVNKMVLNTSSVTIYPEKRAEFFQTMTQLLEPLNGTAGCRAFRLYVDVADENSSLLISEWETETDLNNYLNSADHAILHGAITVLSKRSSELKAVIN